MKKITEIALKRPLVIIVAFTALIIFGLLSYSKMNYNLLPKFDANVVTIITTYTGASASEIENNVTKKVEDGVSSLEGIDKIQGSSQQGLSIVTIQLLNGTDVDKAVADAQRKIDQISNSLPDNADKPIINKFSSDDIPVLRMGVYANTDAKDLYDMISQQIQPQLGNIPGVGQISIVGGAEREIIVHVDKDRLKSVGLSISQLATTVENASISVPAGNIKNSTNEYAIQFDSKVNSADELRKIVVLRNQDGGQVLLQDVADVEDGQEEMTAINHTNGLPSIGIQVMKQSDANAVEVSKLVKARLQDLETQYKNINLKFEIASDQSTYTLKSADAVMEDLGLAIVIVSCVMLLFLHSVRSSLFVLIALPSSIIPTFIMMHLFGMSLNLMTLMALSLVVGILVDDSIVILENIMRHMEMGKKRFRATLDGRTEIGFTALAITMVDVVVFLPMALVNGMIGNIIREFALVVVFSTLMSLIVSFTLTPLLASRFGNVTQLNPKTLWGRFNLWIENGINDIRDWYGNKLGWALRHKRYIFLGVILLLAGTFMILKNGFIGASFISKGDQGELSVKIEMPSQTSLYETNMAAQQAEKIILKNKGVTNVFTNVGYSSSAVSASGNANIAEINVKLVDKEKRDYTADDFGNRIQKELSLLPGAKVTVSEVDITGNASQSDVQVVVKGPNRENMMKVAQQFKDAVVNTPGTQYVEFSTKIPKTQVNVQLDRQKMAIYGLSPAQVGAAISNAFRGDDNAKYQYNGNEYNILVQNDAFDRSSVDDVKDLTFTNSNGQTFTLNQFADVTSNMGEAILERMNRLPSVTINASVTGRSVGTVGNELTEKFNGIMKQVSKNPDAAGVTWQYIGNLENQSESFVSLLGALGLGILLMYLIMVALYENAVYPLVVLTALPLALIGAFLALALTMNELTIFAMIGLIMLMGLVAKNGILLVDFTNHLKARGYDRTHALIEAGRERFRPIMMTTIAMIAGMLPIATAKGSGAEIKSGMAWVIIGGLTSSLVLTLVVVPCVYYIVDGILARIRLRKYRKAKKAVLLRHAQ